METERLYYKNAYQREFEARVLSCAPGKKGYQVILDQSAFYPEGGGQPYDTGTLGGALVREVQEKEGELIHYTDIPLEEGSRVKGEICWERRFDLMQQHSGEHMVSGLIHEAYGYNNVGFHMGRDVITIDFDGELTKEQMKEIETKANQEVWKDRRVRVFYPSQEELKTLSYRSKKELEGRVRIVEFPGVDVCACCGIHVAHTGEIGMIRLLSVQKFREGVRMEMICGKRVLDYFSTIGEQNRQISVQLSAKPEKTGEAVKRLMEENFRLKGRAAAMEEKLFRQEARRLKDAGNVVIFEEELEADGVRKLTDAVMESCGGICAVFSKSQDGAWKYAMGWAGGDVRALTKALNQELNGRGGGKPFFVQGQTGAAKAEIVEFFKKREEAFAFCGQEREAL